LCAFKDCSLIHAGLMFVLVACNIYEGVCVCERERAVYARGSQLQQTLIPLDIWSWLASIPDFANEMLVGKYVLLLCFATEVKGIQQYVVAHNGHKVIKKYEKNIPLEMLRNCVSCDGRRVDED